MTNDAVPDREPAAPGAGVDRVVRVDREGRDDRAAPEDRAAPGDRAALDRAAPDRTAPDRTAPGAPAALAERAARAGRGPVEGRVEGPADWRHSARCRDTDPDTLFVQGALQRDAREVCRACPVRTECLAHALDNRIRFGVWGGMTERERRAVLRRRPDVVSWAALLESARRAATGDARAERSAGQAAERAAERAAGWSAGRSAGPGRAPSPGAPASRRGRQAG